MTNIVPLDYIGVAKFVGGSKKLKRIGHKYDMENSQSETSVLSLRSWSHLEFDHPAWLLCVSASKENSSYAFGANRYES